MSVRDHSRPCEYGSLWPHWTEVAKAKWWQEPECLGGREIVLQQRPDGAWIEIARSDAGHD